MTDDPTWPRYCCAILRDLRGRYLLEKRHADDPDLPGQLVCFGGGRNLGEHPDACIRRELIEEIGSAPDALEMCVLLQSTSGAPIAWFYRGIAPRTEKVITEEGVAAVWATWDELRTLLIGLWNLAAIEAERRGEPIAVVSDIKRSHL